jgi:lysyl endopeptidase
MTTKKKKSKRFKPMHPICFKISRSNAKEYLKLMACNMVPSLCKHNRSMKKLALLFIFVSSGALRTAAQISEGGLPATLQSSDIATLLDTTTIPILSLTAPDIASLQAEDRQTYSPDRPMRIGAAITIDCSFPASGTLQTLPDGQRIWRTRVSVPGAAAIGMYYDLFHLPAGVRYYIYNANRKQILGAYTAAENSDDSLWATEKVQGSTATLELDIEPDVDLDSIAFHINRVADFYAATGYLQRFAENSGSRTEATYFPYDSSSPCEVNAVCPAGISFTEQRHATIHLEYLSGDFAYAATAVLMNNTARDCTPYALTASHVEPTNSTSNTTFAKWIFYFNYETPTCTYTGPQPSTSQTISGALFKARASYDSASHAIVGDFLLVQLRHSIPASYGAYLSGWDNSGATPSGTCISFHHPSGDVKKLSTTNHASPYGNFNGGEADSHWEVHWGQGGTEEGSSGSGLFDPSGRLIGTLSGGGGTPSCIIPNGFGQEMAAIGEYSKLSLNWYYTHESPSTSATRLHDWLDPTGSGATKLDAMATPCASAAITTPQVATPAVSLYPNPTHDLAWLRIDHADAHVEITDLLGNVLLQAQPYADIPYPIAFHGMKPGLYFVKVYFNSTMVCRKLVIE